MAQKFATTKQTAEIFSISSSTLKALRLGHLNRPPILTEGIHWVRLAEKNILFNIPLLEDFLANRSNPTAHQKAIEFYLRSLPSSQ